MKGRVQRTALDPGRSRPVSRGVPVRGPRVWFRSGSVLFALSVLSAGCGRGGEVENPEPLYGDVPIAYPMDLWDADVEGQVLLRVRVTDMGGVDSVEVLESSGYPAFDSAAVQGALGLEYRPATRSGRRISVWAKVPVHFTKSQAQEGTP